MPNGCRKPWWTFSFQASASRSASAVVYSHQLRITVGQAVRDLELLATVYEPADMENRVEHLPL